MSEIFFISREDITVPVLWVESHFFNVSLGQPVLLGSQVNHTWNRGQSYLAQRSTIPGTEVNHTWNRGQPYLEQSSIIPGTYVDDIWNIKVNIIWNRCLLYQEQRSINQNRGQSHLKQGQSETEVINIWNRGQ